MASKANHKDELENTKYRNWVKAGLSLKYLKDGIGDFADECAKSEVDRILQKLGLPSGTSCNLCTLTTLRPAHVTPPKAKHCSIGQRHCNCLQNNTTSCPNNICGKIYDEIVDSHGTRSPNWKNTDITKWTPNPWEIARCFINAPGYEATRSASDTDLAGLLHVFINSKGFQGHLLCAINDFEKIRNWRNSLFHSPKMELEDQQLTDGINDIITILNDEKELKDKECSKQAIHKLSELQHESFIITTETEAEVCRAALESITQITKELRSAQEEVIRDIAEAKKDIMLKHEEAEKVIYMRQEEAVKNVKDAADTCISLTQREVPELRYTVKTLELEIKTLNKRLTEVEQAVDDLKKAEDKTTEHLKKMENIIALKRKLKERYRTYYIKTSQSPLKTTENDFEIGQVYVPPNMTKVIEITPEKGGKKESTVQILDYSEIFLTGDKPNKTIYILGDVGTGKSAFCKMMIRNWCISSEEHNESTEEDVRTLGQFELLFYLPLVTLSHEDSLLEMITWYYGDICSKDDLLNILQLIPERCLVLADGIDEWKPKTVKRRRAHETHGLPAIDKMDHVTIVMTSRPSAQGILNMEKSQYDVKVRLDGIRDVKSLIEKLYPKSNSKDIVGKLHDLPIKDLEKTPHLLQQIVWLQQQNIDLGKSISEVYSNVVNIAFRWNTKHADKELYGHTQSAGSKFTELSFPDKIKHNYPEFILHSSVIFGLGKMAFEIMTQGSKLLFGTVELNKNGIDKHLLVKMLETGLLTEEVRFDTSKENTQFYFTHTSFLEYFAALYIASHIERDKTSCYDSSTCHSSIFDIIMKRCHSITDVIRLENMLVIVCGLAPALTYDVCMLMYNTLQQNDIYEPKEIVLSFSSTRELERLSYQCRDLANHCIHECKLSNPQFTPKVPYYAVFLGWFGEPDETIKLLQYVDLLTVRCCISLKNNPLDSLTVFQNLQILKLEFCCHTDDKLSALTDYITKTVTLRCIRLKHDSFLSGSGCSEKNNRSPMIYNIDLSQHKQLRSLRLYRLGNIHVSVINTAKLNRCIKDNTTYSTCSTHAEKMIDLAIIDITLKHVELSDWMTFINGSVLLKTIKITNISCSEHPKGCSHVLELLHHNQLQTLDVTVSGGVSLHLKDVNTINLNDCFIRNTKISISSAESTKLRHLTLCYCTLTCDELAVLITNSVLMRKLDIQYIRCSVHKGCSNAIDLSQHNQLEVLKSRRVHFSRISTLNLKQCELDNAVTSFSLTDTSSQCQLCLHFFSLKHHELSELVKFITRSVSLKELRLNGIKCLDHNKCNHKIDLSQYTQLEELTIDGPFTCDKINTSNLKHCSTNKTEVLHCLRDSVNLQTLILRRLSYSKDVHDCVLTLPKLQYLILWKMNIEDGVLLMIPEMKCLGNIDLDDVNMSESSCLQFMESLLTLNQSVECGVLFKWESSTEQFNINNYLSVNKDKFQVKYNTGCSFRFRSLKLTC